MNEDYHRIIIGGPTGTGKSHLVLTAPKGVMNLYHDRAGGDIDLRDMEDLGVHLWKGNHQKPREALMAKIKQLRDGEIVEKKLKTVVLDTFTYLQQWQASVVAEGSLRGMSLAKNGNVVNDMRDVLRALFQLPAHVVILTHIKEEPIKDAKGNVLTTVWRNDIMPALYKEVSREVSLLGYTWKKTAKKQGEKNRYGVCFVENMGNYVFQNAKAPDGWGPGEVANITAWFKRLSDEAAAQREAARAAILAEPEWRVPVEVDNTIPGDLP